MEKEVGISNLYIKYMVCLRDRLIVKSELDKLGVDYRFSIHDAIEFSGDTTDEVYNRLKSNLLKHGLILLDRGDSILIDRIINTITDVIHHSEQLPRVKFEDILTDKSTLSDESLLKVFSDVKGMSILQFIINQKIERMKDLLLYEEHSLSEIANILNYKNTDQMIAQFKKYTDLPPNYFKKLKNERKKIIIGSSQKSNNGESISLSQ